MREASDGLDDPGARWLGGYALLFEPGCQLMQQDAASWTEADRQAVVGLKILRALTSPSRWSEAAPNELIRTLVEEPEDVLDAAQRLLSRLGCEDPTLASLARLVVHARRRLVRNAGATVWGDRALAVHFRLLNRVEAESADWTIRLAEFLQRHAQQRRGPTPGRLQLAQALTRAPFGAWQADAEQPGTEVPTLAAACQMLTFVESTSLGMPAVLAARHDGVMPWLILSLANRPSFWFLDATADWDCVGMADRDLLCRPRSESAILAAFSRLDQDDNIAFGALSGRLREEEVRAVLRGSPAWGTDAVLERARGAPWAYGHQWGGGADEHVSIFATPDRSLLITLAEALGVGSDAGR